MNNHHQNLHYRSCSEQLQPTQPLQHHHNHHQNNHQNNHFQASHNHHHHQQNLHHHQQSAIVLGNNRQPAIGEQSQDSFVYVYSDSQSSLDRLFNPPNQQASVPLRNRNLPASFFNPSWQQTQQNQPTATNQNQNNHNHSLSNNQQPPPAPNQQQLHTRSVSLFQPSYQPASQTNGFNPPNQSRNQNGPAPQQQPHYNLHMRSRSTIAPMTSGCGQPASGSFAPSGQAYFAPDASGQLQHNQPVQQQPYFATTQSYPSSQQMVSQPNSSPSCYQQPANQQNQNQISNPNQFHISHSQPYAPYEPSLSTSSGSLNPSSSLTTTPSSSTSNENNSLLGNPETMALNQQPIQRKQLWMEPMHQQPTAAQHQVYSGYQ